MIRHLDVDHAEGRETGDGEGGFHPIHRQEKFCQCWAAGKTSWNRPQDNTGGAMT